MKILIADDEPLARQRLKRLLTDIDENFIIFADASNGLDALNHCISKKPDLVLLDIRMPKMDGLQAAAEIRKANLDTAIVFITAYDKYALAAFDAHAIDYLLKPVKKQRLELMLEKATKLTPSLDQIAVTDSLGTLPRTHLCSHSHLGVEIVNVPDILCFKADNKYVSAITETSSVLLEESLKTLEVEFADQFLRTHRNSLVNVNAVKLLNKNSSGQLRITLNGLKEPINVSRRHQANVNKRLKK
jgi:two-component system response regulator AlgR